ncbi:MAG TPA: LysR family transcriptional regulator [Tepidimicrobium sp.]|nr:LysR family transcriptional regulator [Tepidimicrobium sp.]
MNIRHLRVFLAVVDSNSMTRAAEKLFISQPSVSQTIRELESHYNVKLFERLSKRLYITKEGEQLLGYARHIVSLFDKMEESMSQSIKNSTIRIGATITIGTYILSKLTTRFINKNPGIKIKSVVDNTTIIEDMVLKNKLLYWTFH